MRTSARVALWAALILTGVSAWLLDRYSRPIAPENFSRIEEEQELWHGIRFTDFPEVQLLQKYVRIDTSDPDANEIAGAEFLAAQLGAAGVRATIERVGEKGANLWAFVEGDDPKALALMGHIDVEPASQSQGWKFPPFSATVRGPWIYGRGMYDMKSLTIAQLLATIDVARSGIAGHRPKRSLLFLQTSGEEMGSDTGTRWLLAEHPELYARIGAALTEGGVIEASSPTEIKYWGIEFGQKRFAKITVCASDPKLVRGFARELGDGVYLDPEPEVHPAVQAFLDAYASTREGQPYKRLLANPERLPLERDRFNRLAPFMKALFRNELRPLSVRRESDGTWALDLWFHLLPDADLDSAVDALLPAWRTAGLARSNLRVEGTSWTSPLDSPEFLELERQVRAQFPGVPVGPYFLPWAMTDARYLRAMHIPAYGFSPFPVTVADTLQIGKANERMQLPAFRSGVELYRSAVKALIE